MKIEKGDSYKKMEVSFRKILGILLVLTYFSGMAHPPFEILETKDGSIFMGRTFKQTLGKNSITEFLVDSSIRVIPRYKILNITKEKKSFDKLSSEDLKNWLYKNPRFITRDVSGERKVEISRINLEGEDNILQGVILEKSPSYYKIYTHNSSREIIFDDSIKKIIYSPRDPMDINGIIDEVVTTDGTIYRGQLYSWDNEYTGLLLEEGSIEMIPHKDIAQKRILPLNNNVPLIEQVRFIDEIVGDNNINGIITVKNRRPSNNKPPYYTVLNEYYDSQDNIEMESVKTITKTRNDKFKPLRDIRIDSPEDIFLNEILLRPSFIENYQNDKFNLNGFKIKNDNPSIINYNENNEIELVVKDSELNKLIYLIPIKRKLNNKQIEEFYYFEYENLINDNISPINTINTTSGNKKISYALPPGEYLIYRKNDKSAYLLRLN